METTSAQLPRSKKVFVESSRIQGVRVPFREIELSSTAAHTGIEINEPVRVYDTSGPESTDIRRGLPLLRAEWITSRGDVEEYQGRIVRPIDNGYANPEQNEYAQAKGNFQHFSGS